MSILNKVLGTNIRERRKELGMSQDMLAKLAGYKDRSSITKLEKGETDIVLTRVVAIANALETTAEQLMVKSNNQQIS